jgi:hypothetical protein
MFNLLVAGDDEAWERSESVLEIDRFLEYTDDELKGRFRGLSADARKALTALPALFAYETPVGKPARVGSIKTIHSRDREIRITFEFDPAIAPIDPERIKALVWELEIGRLEMNRTHWAVKTPDLIDVLRTAGLISGVEPGTRARAASAVPQVPATAPRSKIFLVHGRDEAVKHEVAHYLLRLGLDPVILHERPNAGRTLIAKFSEEAGDVAFAVVLMTPDDTGSLKGAPRASRARQNVVFELGYLLGKLGPRRVCALISAGVERPSDFEGVVYVPFGPGTVWRTELARELRTAGIPFDLEKTLV